jgi:hypothetical protein
MPFDLPPRLADKDLRALGLLLPGAVSLRLEGAGLLVTFNAFRDGAKLPLFILEVTLDKKKDFSGTLLSEFLEDLGGTMATTYRALRDSSETITDKALQISGGAVREAVRRHLAGGEYKVRTREILTMAPDDWYPPEM